VPVTGSELAEVMPAGPRSGCFVGDYLVTVGANTGGTLSGGTFTVLDTSTMVSKSYSGLTVSGAGSRHMAVAFDGLAWTSAQGFSRQLQSIDPATGGVTDHGNASNPIFVMATNDRVWRCTNSGTLLSGYSPSLSNTVNSTVGIPEAATAFGVIDNRLLLANATAVYEIDQSTGNIANTYPMPVATAPLGRGAVIGDSIYWGVNASGYIWGFNETTNTPFQLALTPAGAPNMAHEFVAHQGILVGLEWPGSEVDMDLRMVDPDTGQWENVTEANLPTDRDARFFCVSDGTNIWIPSGIPTT
jgi:hypothetical protein